MEARLYGIEQSNRSGNDLWGKNQFNSTFPTALACWMRDNGHKAVYLRLNENLEVVAEEISFDEVFNSTARNSDLTFDFESKFDPYQRFAFDDIHGIDLVVKENGKWARPLEIKLTVIPDNTTYKKPLDKWGSELVIRAATTSYCAMGIADSCESEMPKVRSIFEPVCSKIQHWDNKTEIFTKREPLLAAINQFQQEFCASQKPFLLQPIWKTRGKSPILDQNAFDIFVWSDFALCRLFLDRKEPKNNDVTRYLRCTARLAKILYEISCSGKTNINKIYTEMAFGLQTDKEFAIPGHLSAQYMKSTRRYNPALGPEILSQIILDGGEKNLSPERRFDQTIYYAAAAAIFDQE